MIVMPACARLFRPRRAGALLAIVALTWAFVSACSGDDSTAEDSSADESSAEAGEEFGEEESGEEEELGENEEFEEFEEEAEARGAEIPDDAFLFRRLMPGGVPDRQIFAEAHQDASRLHALGVRADRPLAQKTWHFEGPRTVGGRIVDAVVDPTRPDSLYVAAASNGVWHSTDAGETFTSVWPASFTHAMGALAIAPDGTLFAGTGETNPGGGSITYGGDGIYRSTDGGDTWQRVGLTDSGTIGRIMVDPDDPDRIWAAVSGNLFVPGGQRGVYVSENGGTTWRRTLAPRNDVTGATDLAIDPSNPDHVLATMWDHIRRPSARIYTGLGSGVWETRNGGDTWRRLGPARGLPAADANIGRIGVAFAPSDGSRAYAVYANDETGAFENFFVSSNGGKSWSQAQGAADLTDSQSVYGWWFGRLFVDPDDADRVFVPGLDIWESTDGGESFDTLCCMHVDQHIMVWDPNDPGRVYAGNDGGLYVSEDDGANESWTKGADQPWSQYSTLDVSVQDPSRIIGGLQDNGTPASWTDPPFEDVFGGDGQRALINPTDMDNYYACAQYGVCGGYVDDEFAFDLPITSKRFPYLTQMEFQPGNPAVMYAGGDKLNRSTDGGRTFTVLTDDLGKGEAGDEPNPLYRNHYGTISALAVAPSNPKVIWVGTDNGYLYHSSDRGKTWKELPNPVRPKLWISRIAIDPSDAQTVYLAFSGYREGDNSAYLLRTRNAGKAWTDITGNLPHAPVTDVIVVGRNLYVSTDVGVFGSPKSTPLWYGVGIGMPRLVATDLRYMPTNKTLYAATFGMGVWSLSVG
jgi:photosystem II stability/assembly factor-like uncharacterized protein